jgi:hypothetical protein
MPDDTLPAALDEIRELVSERDKLVACAAVAAVSVAEFNAAQDRLAERVPRLLAALDEVLKLHHRIPPRPVSQRNFDSCRICRNYRWPCPTIQAISRALLGENAHA